VEKIFRKIEAPAEFPHCGSFSWISTCRKTCFLDRAMLKPQGRKNKGTKYMASDRIIHIPVWWILSLDIHW